MSNHIPLLYIDVINNPFADLNTHLASKVASKQGP